MQQKESIEYSIILPIPIDFKGIDIFWLEETKLFTKDELQQASGQEQQPGGNRFQNDKLLLIKDINRICLFFLNDESQKIEFVKRATMYFLKKYDTLAVGINFSKSLKGNGSIFYNQNNAFYQLFNKDEDLFGVFISAARNDFTESFEIKPFTAVVKDNENTTISKVLSVRVNYHFQKTNEDWNPLEIITRADSLLSDFKRKLDVIQGLKS